MSSQVLGRWGFLGLPFETEVVLYIQDIQETTMSTQMIIRIDPATKARFDRLARAEGKNSSRVVRELMAAYLVEHDLASSVDGIWNRLKVEMKAAGSGPRDVARAVGDARRPRA
jgi:predicted DNA-binding protein